MKFEQEKETSNQKALRLTLWILCFFSLGFALVNIPRQGDIDGIKQEIKSNSFSFFLIMGFICYILNRYYQVLHPSHS